MEFNKCSRCGNFYVSKGNVCPNCEAKDTLEYSTFKNFVQENELSANLDVNGLSKISIETGIAMKNLNRFISYEDFGVQKSEDGSQISDLGKNKL